MTDQLRHILITGAKGRIGSAFYTEMVDRYRFRLADLTLPETIKPGDEAVICDIADFDQCLAACQGIDTVLHLAANPSPEASYESLERNNLRGTHNIFEAAAQSGVQRVIFASSIHAVGGYPLDSPIEIDWPVNPTNLYGASKVYGEALCRVYSNSRGLSCIAVRIGAYHAPWHHPQMPEGDKMAYVSRRDLNQLLVRSIEAPDIDFALVVGQSDNSKKRMSIESTQHLLGYSPEDDGFSVFGRGSE